MTPGGARLVAVLGYSSGHASGQLHPICAARLARAVEEVRPDDAVLFSGWRRGREPASEAELMARGWTGRAGRILVDTAARTTHGNVVGTAAAARALSAREVVLVTSGWHARRAALLLRAASRQPVVLAATDERGTAGTGLRELVCWLLVPLQVVVARRGREREPTRR